MDEPQTLVQLTAERSEVVDAASFEAFFRTESAALYRRLWLITGNRAESEDIMQDAFLRLWERWDRMGEVRDPTAYLYVTAMNLFRRRYRRAIVLVRKLVAPDPAADDFALADDRQVVRQTLASLAPRQRAALVLTELLGFSSEEAGRALGVQAASVRALTHQGRAAFARAMEVDDA